MGDPVVIKILLPHRGGVLATIRYVCRRDGRIPLSWRPPCRGRQVGEGASPRRDARGKVAPVADEINGARRSGARGPKPESFSHNEMSANPGGYIFVKIAYVLYTSGGGERLRPGQCCQWLCHPTTLEVRGSSLRRRDTQMRQLANLRQSQG
jgi:hypothetical protein